MKRSDYEDAIRKEVEHWPHVTVEFASGAKHPKAKFTYAPPDGEPMMLARPFAGTPSDAAFGVHQMLGDMRRIMRQLGAKRDKPEPSREDDEAPYRKPNEGREKRPDPVKREPAPVKEGVADKLVAAGAATDEQARAARGDAVTVGGSLEVSGSIAIGQRAAVIETPDDDDPAAARRMVELLAGCGIVIVLVGQHGVGAVIAEAADLVEDGIYFGLPAEVYHAVPRLSASGLQRLCVSPATFWKGSWLDPDRPELDEEETRAQVLGKAYHVARLEPARFHDTYVREISKADFPARGFLSSDEKVKAALKAAGVQQTVTGETLEERAERLVDTGYEGTIFTLEKARWDRTVAGRIPIAAKYFDQIATDMDRIRDSGDIAPLLSGGQAEVSVFWTDRHGLKMKARIDYLVLDHWVDFKTFDNSRGKELGQALADAVRYNRYHVQAVTYRDAVEAIRTGGLAILGNATDDQRALVAGIQIRPDQLACWFVFQEKGGVPNLLAREFAFDSVGHQRDAEIEALVEDEDRKASARAALSQKTQLCARADYEIDRAKRTFVLYSEVYEPGRPWFPIEATGRFDDLDFNQYWLEGRA